MFNLNDHFEYQDKSGAIRRFRLTVLPDVANGQFFYRGRYLHSRRNTRPMGEKRLAMMRRIDPMECEAKPVRIDGPAIMVKPPTFVVVTFRGAHERTDCVVEAVRAMRRRGLYSAVYRVHDRVLMAVAIAGSSRGHVPPFPEEP